MTIETTVIPSLRQVIYDTYANFPSAGLAKGDLGWATDQECLYRWSGSAWQTISISKASIEGKASDDLKNSNDTERTLDNAASYTKVKEMKFNAAFNGEMRVKFDVKAQQGDDDFYGKIYKNGSPVGIEHQDTGSVYSTFSEDLEVTLATDDLLQIYIYNGDGLDVWCQNMRLYYNGIITEIAGLTLVTELLCERAAVSTTNQDPS